MKKFLFLALIFVFLLTGCSEKAKDTPEKSNGTDADIGQTDERDTEDGIEKLNVDYHVVQTLGGRDGVIYPEVRLLHSEEEASAFMKQNRFLAESPFNFGESYSSNYFYPDGNILLSVLISGDDRYASYTLDSIGESDGGLVVNIKTATLEAELPDGAVISGIDTSDTESRGYWYFLIELDESKYAVNEKDVIVFIDGVNTKEKVEKVTCSNENASISIELPHGWYYKTEKREPISSVASEFSISIYPKGMDDFGRIELSYLTSFGVCGTGLVQEEIQLGKNTFNQGTFDNHSYWSFMTLHADRGEFVIFNNAYESWWFDYENEVMRILETASFTEIPKAWHTFEYEGVTYDLSEAYAGVNGVSEWGRVGKYVIAEGHVNPRNSIYAVINTETQKIEESFAGSCLARHPDISCCVYAFWGEIRSIGGALIETLELSPYEYISNISFTDNYKALEVTVSGDSAEETHRISLKKTVNSTSEAVTDFSLKLLRESIQDGESTLISPLSVLTALSMTANGADGETLSQMENVFGASVTEINEWVKTLVEDLPEKEAYTLHLANSIWLNDSGSFEVNEDFLKTCDDFYKAGVYEKPFDNSTLNEINAWVEENTDGAVKNILDRISEDAVMYLINALSFDAEWEKAYMENQIREGEFTTEDGEKEKAEFMYSTENRYLSDAQANGFIKYYKDRKYAFAALLPKKGVSVSEYVSSLDSKHLAEMIEHSENFPFPVNTMIPKFEAEYKTEMSESLQVMGMSDAFSPGLASFSRLGKSGKDNIYISRVIHQAYLKLDGLGTKAGAATVVEMEPTSARPTESEPPARVYLDRPFVYMLIDCETNIPFFIGTLMSVN